MDHAKDRGKVLQYCPKCGAKAIQFIGTKLVLCRSCDFEFYFNVATAAGALITDDRGRLMVIERAREPKKGMWDLPGGFVDSGESVEASLRREIQEELVLEIASMEFLCSYPNTYDYMGVRYATVDLGFICQIDNVAVAKVCQSEVAQLLFVAPEELDVSRFGFVSIRKIVQRYLEVRGIS